MTKCVVVKNFINGEITAKDIAKVKRDFKTNSNQVDAQTAYQNVLADTQTAVDNIEECLEDVSALRKIYIGFSYADISFLDTVLGLNPRGENDSHYRDYLTLDEGSIVGIRISGHPTTKKTLLGKANNNAQYLLQVVLVPQNPNPTAHDAITTDTKVGNLQVLTQVYVGADYNWDNLEDLLKKIADYLTCPEYSGAGRGRPQQQTTINQQQNCSMNRRTVTLTEARLRNMIREAVKGIINEYHDPTGYGDSQLTVGDLLFALEQYGGENERVEIFDGVNGFKCIHCIDGPYLFTSRKDYETYKKRGEEYEKRYSEEHSGKYGGGEGNQYLSNPSSLPAGLH